MTETIPSALESDFQKRMAHLSAIKKLEGAHTLIELMSLEVRINNAWIAKVSK